MMSNVMGNRRRYIKKQIFLALGLFFSCSNLGAMCPQTVGAVTPGEAIWLVVSRIGEAANVIQSQLCELANSQSQCALDCSFTFGQADIPLTISAPGTYCMKENVSFAAGSAITVNSSDVTIDLKGHIIDGGNNNILVGILLNHGFQNIIIQNGTIQNFSAVGCVGIKDSDSGPILQNVIIRDMSFNNIGFSPVQFAYIPTFPPPNPAVQDLLIENCDFYNAGQLTVSVLGAIVRNCRSENINNGFNGGFIIGDLGAGFLESSPSPYMVVEDCILTASFGSYNALVVRNSVYATVRNCVVDGSISDSFLFSAFINLSVSDCIAQACGTHGFTIAAGNNTGFNPGALVMERCVAQQCVNNGFTFAPTTALAQFKGVKLVECIAENCAQNGFFIRGSAQVEDGAIFKNCCATSNLGNGFLFETIAAEWDNLLFDGCVAQNNGGAGFALHGSSGIPLRNVLFSNCAAQNNAFDGFDIGLGGSTVDMSGIICLGCVSENNASAGFHFASTVTGSKIFNCCSLNNTGTGINNEAGAANAILGNTAFNNGGADITGVVDGTLLVSQSFPGAAAGATSWVNIIT
jgi:hypothetical protein